MACIYDREHLPGKEKGAADYDHSLRACKRTRRGICFAEVMDRINLAAVVGSGLFQLLFAKRSGVIYRYADHRIRRPADSAKRMLIIFVRHHTDQEDFFSQKLLQCVCKPLRSLQIMRAINIDKGMLSQLLKPGGKSSIF